MHFFGEQVMIWSNEIHGLASNELPVELVGGRATGKKGGLYLDECPEIFTHCSGRKHHEINLGRALDRIT